MAGMTKTGICVFLLGCAASLAAADAMPVGTAADSAASPPSVDADQLTEIVIEAPEPRYVAPTRRDQIGRIWAPVYINGKGPFRMVLDTGASRSGVTASVVTALGMVPDASEPVKLQGATGSLIVPTVRVATLLVGDVLINGSRLPILKDALGGAEGILGNEGLVDRRVFIDFGHDLIIISRSHDQRAGAGFMTIPFSLEHGRLLIVNVQLGRVRAKAIIDTGSQTSVANMALRDALLSRRSKETATIDELQGVTDDIQQGEGRSVPPIEFGPIEIHVQHMTFADAHIFRIWHLTEEPALLIGMDALGMLDTLIIDYRRSELQLRMRAGS